MEEKIESIIHAGWESYCHKIASGLLNPINEKMMQLQLAQIYQTLAPVYEYERSESIKVLLEVRATIRETVTRSIDLVLEHTLERESSRYAIELKCFRLRTQSGGLRRAQNLGMYDYWEDIENCEGYVKLPGYAAAYQLTITDDPYYVEGNHSGPQVAVYSTARTRANVTGSLLVRSMSNRKGEIHLSGTYGTTHWETLGCFFAIIQKATAGVVSGSTAPPLEPATDS